MNEAVARRYASALADVALEQIKADQVKTDLSAFVEAFYGSSDLRNFLETPAVGPELKRKVIAKLAEKMGWDPAVRNFVYLLVDHRRTELLREIQQAFAAEMNARLGIAEAHVTSAGSLSDAGRRSLPQLSSGGPGKKSKRNSRKIESLLGGAVVRVGSTVYDGSVREQLNRLREQLETE